MELLGNAEMQERRSYIKENAVTDIETWIKEWSNNE